MCVVCDYCGTRNARCCPSRITRCVRTGCIVSSDVVGCGCVFNENVLFFTFLVLSVTQTIQFSVQTIALIVKCSLVGIGGSTWLGVGRSSRFDVGGSNRLGVGESIRVGSSFKS